MTPMVEDIFSWSEFDEFINNKVDVLEIKKLWTEEADEFLEEETTDKLKVYASKPSISMVSTQNSSEKTSIFDRKLNYSRS